MPGLAAVGGAKEAAFGVGAIGMAESGDEDDVGIGGMDDDFADGAGIFEAYVFPGFAGIDRFVDAVALGEIATDAGFAGANVDGVGIGGGDGEGADGRRFFVIEEGLPGESAIGGFPDAATDGAEVPGVRIAGDAGGGERAAAPVRADGAVLEALF